MTKGWDWVIGTGLYVAALVLSWLTLFSIERFGATDVKAWAPFLQALLSAAAIFTAWLFQDLKRRADRRETEADSLHTAMHIISKIEWTLGETLRLRKEGFLNRANLNSTVTSLEQNTAVLRRLNFGHLAVSARNDILDLLEFASQAIAHGNTDLEAKGAYPQLSMIYLGFYAGIFESRTNLIEGNPGPWSGHRRKEPSDLLMKGDDPLMIAPETYTSAEL